jgi:hypothetical protein
MLRGGAPVRVAAASPACCRGGVAVQRWAVVRWCASIPVAQHQADDRYDAPPMHSARKFA